jgi:hypothetical protein
MLQPRCTEPWHRVKRDTWFNKDAKKFRVDSGKRFSTKHSLVVSPESYCRSHALVERHTLRYWRHFRIPFVKRAEYGRKCNRLISRAVGTWFEFTCLLLNYYIYLQFNHHKIIIFTIFKSPSWVNPSMDISPIWTPVIVAEVRKLHLRPV